MFGDQCFSLGEDVYCKVGSRTPYQRVGVLTHPRLGPLPLIGKRTQLKWYYFTESGNQTLPIIDKKGRSCREVLYGRGCEELNDGDTVGVQGYPGETFTVSLF